MSKLMRDISQRIQNGNLTLQQKLRAYINQFIRHSEISAQEAVLHELGISMSQCSDGVIFISTHPPNERVEIRKSTAELEKLKEKDPFSTD